jgi:hypothetical protein
MTLTLFLFLVVSFVIWERCSGTFDLNGKGHDGEEFGRDIVDMMARSLEGMLRKNLTVSKKRYITVFEDLLIFQGVIRFFENLFFRKTVRQKTWPAPKETL